MSKFTDALVGAEFVAGHEATEDLGLWVEYAQRLGDIAQSQFRGGWEDQQAFVTDLTSGENPIGAFWQHMGRTQLRAARGASDWFALHSDHMARLNRMHSAMWQPFTDRFKV